MATGGGRPVEQEVLDELARLFGDGQMARALLEAIGFPRQRIPPAGDPRKFWSAVCDELLSTQGSVESLLHAAATRFPFSTVLAPWTDKALAREKGGTSIVVSGFTSVHDLIDQTRVLARDLGIPGPVQLGWANGDNLEIVFSEANAEALLPVAQALERAGHRTSLVENQFRDYLLQKLFLEGPDQARFEVVNVPASTPIRDFGRATMSQYEDGMWPHDRGSQSRPAAIDQVEPSGGSRRLDSAVSLRDAGIRDGATLHIAPEPLAGGLPHRSLPRFHADTIGAPDMLGIGPEVEALASLVAAWSVEPPLSIGLFGDWGSGKSFFMQQMMRRVARLSAAARSQDLPQRDVAYYKHIVQIEFNAWHYLEGNLWASLVEHIFTNLQFAGQGAGGDGDAERLRRELFKQLELAQEIRGERRCPAGSGTVARGGVRRPAGRAPGRAGRRRSGKSGRAIRAAFRAVEDRAVRARRGCRSVTRAARARG